MLSKSAEALPILISAVSGLMLAAAALTTQPLHGGSIGMAQVAAEADEVDLSSGISLDRVDNPAATLSGAMVETSKGKEIGRVRSVALDEDGKPLTVKISTGGLFGVGTFTKSVEARDLLYIDDRHALVSRLTTAELVALPTGRRKH